MPFNFGSHPPLDSHIGIFEEFLNKARWGVYIHSRHYLLIW